MAIAWSSPAAGSTVYKQVPFGASVAGIVGAQAGDLIVVRLMGAAIGTVGIGAGQTTATVVCTVPAGMATGSQTFVAEHRRGGTPLESANRSLVVATNPHSIVFGADTADAALWNDATRHRWSKYGDYAGGYKNVETGISGASPTAFPIRFVGVNGVNYTVRVKLDSHTWYTSGVTTGTGAEQTTNGLSSLPWAQDASWTSWLGSAGAKTLTVELVRVSDSVVAASDTAAWTMFIPALSITEPSGTVPDVFDVGLDIDEWYYGYTTRLRAALLAEVDGEEYACFGMGGYDRGQVALNGMTEVTTDVDLGETGRQWLYSRWTYPWEEGPPEGSVTLRARWWPDGVNAVDVDVALTHDETFDISITNVAEAATVPAGSYSVGLRLAQGWWVDSIAQVQVWRGGAWVNDGASTVRATGHSGWPDYVDEPQRQRTATVSLQAGDTKLRARWYYMSGPDEIELDLGVEINITVNAVTPPPPPPPTPPPGTAYLDWVFPGDGAVVDTVFAATVNYGGYAAGTAMLRILAAGATGTKTLHDAAVAIDSTGTLNLSLDFGVAAEGAYDILATLTQDIISQSDTAALTYDATPTVGDPPTVTIDEPLEAASVSGAVDVVATADDDRGLYSVQLLVDGQITSELFAANYSGRWKFVWDTTLYANGSHVLTVIAWDVDGNDAQDSVTVNLVNAALDRERIVYTEQLGTDDDEVPINAASADWAGVLENSLEALEPVVLPEALSQLYNLQVGYNAPGTTLDWGQYRLVPNVGKSHSLVPTGERTMRWAMKATARQTVASWEIAAADVVRLAALGDDDLLALATTPHTVQRLHLADGSISEFADLGYLTVAPTDMAAADGKVLVAAGAELVVLDQDAADEPFRLLLDPDVAAITALAVSGTTVVVAADVVGGGARLYNFTYPVKREVASHDESITALAVIGTTVWVGDAQGRLYTLGSGLTLAYDTQEAMVSRIASQGSLVWAGTGDTGKAFRKVGSWGLGGDFGWTRVAGLAEFQGWLWAGGVGTGGQYLWYQGTSAWIQTLELADATAVNDLLNVTVDDAEQLFAAATGDGVSSWLYRVEVAAAGRLQMGAEFPGFRFQVLKAR